LSSTVEKYRKFWAAKTDFRIRSNTPEFRRLSVAELKLLIGERTPASILEIGCGNGQFFDYLGFSRRSYRGVDFSSRMLAVFRQNHPELDLVEAEGSSYLDDRSYDLILAYDVVSQFSPAMLAQHCRNARRMMHPESLLVWTCILWRSLRHTYDLGMWSNSGRASIIRWAKSQVRRMAGGDLMGRWYTPHEIDRIARQNFLCASFYGSMTYPYRFHAVLQKEMPGRATGVWPGQRRLATHALQEVSAG